MSMHSYAYLMTGIRVPERDIEWNNRSIQELLDEVVPILSIKYGEGSNYVYIGQIICSTEPYTDGDLSQAVVFPDIWVIHRMIEDLDDDLLSKSSGVKNWMFQVWK